MEDWSRCFKKFDQDNSGSIDCYEMSHALRTFGYNVSDQFVGTLIQTFDKYGEFRSQSRMNRPFLNIETVFFFQAMEILPLIILCRLASPCRP